MSIPIAVTRTDRRQWLAYSLAVLFVIACIALMLMRGELQISSYKAFYCAGSITLHGGNPYLMEPLRACEHAVFSAPTFPQFAVEPAPLPTYALAGFAVLALAPAQVSHLLYIVLMLAALMLTAFALARISGFSPALLVLVCLPVWIITLSYGEIPALAVAAIALCGLALQEERPVLAAVFACAAMIQPQVALPLCLGLFVLVPKTRVPLIGGAVLLAAIGIVAGGWQNTIAYYTTYLPLHAASEIIATDQYSLTHVLHVAGLPDRIALTLGSISYLFMTALGIFAAWRLSTNMRTPALVAFAPPAFVLLGGTFIHDTQMFAAFPLVLTLLARAQRMRTEIAVSAALLCVSWTQTGSRAVDFAILAGAFSLGLLIFNGKTAHFAKGALLAVALAAGIWGVNRLPAVSETLTLSADRAPLAATAPASDGWNELLRSSPFWSVPSPRSEGRKVPTWIALVLLVVASLRNGNNGRGS